MSRTAMLSASSAEANGPRRRSSRSTGSMPVLAGWIRRARSFFGVGKASSFAWVSRGKKIARLPSGLGCPRSGATTATSIGCAGARARAAQERRWSAADRAGSGGAPLSCGAGACWLPPIRIDLGGAGTAADASKREAGATGAGKKRAALSRSRSASAPLRSRHRAGSMRSRPTITGSRHRSRPRAPQPVRCRLPSIGRRALRCRRQRGCPTA